MTKKTADAFLSLLATVKTLSANGLAGLVAVGAILAVLGIWSTYMGCRMPKYSVGSEEQPDGAKASGGVVFREVPQQHAGSSIV